MVISWLCRILELWTMGLQKQELMLGGENYADAAMHCARYKVVYDQLQIRHPDWNLPEAKAGTYQDEMLDYFRLANGSVSYIINSTAGKVQGEGVAFVTLEEFGKYPNPQSMFAQAGIVGMGSASEDGSLQLGFTCCITNLTDNPKYREFKKMGPDDMPLEELFPGYSIRIMKGGALFIYMEWNADESRTPKWLEDLRIAMSEVSYEFNLEILMIEGASQGALWDWDTLNQFRLSAFPPGITLVKTVIALDPSVSDPERAKNPNKQPDACGIVVASLDSNGEAYVWKDLSMVARPELWAQTAVDFSKKVPDCVIIYEANQGGELIRDTLKTYGARVRIVAVHASKGKRTRAEPVAALDSLGKIHHVGHLTELEKELTGWDASNPSAPSPNRLDARVWAIYGLGLCRHTSAQVLNNMIDGVDAAR